MACPYPPIWGTSSRHRATHIYAAQWDRRFPEIQTKSDPRYRMGNVLTGFDKTGRKTWSFHEFPIPGTGGFIARTSVNFLTAIATEKVDIFVVH
jgi:hypothetical protein